MKNMQDFHNLLSAENGTPTMEIFDQVINEFSTLPYAGSSSKVLEEAQEILIQCGAVSYCIHELLNRYRTAGNILSTLSLIRPQELTSLFEDGVMPAYKLFQAVSETPVDLSILLEMADGE